MPSRTNDSRTDDSRIDRSGALPTGAPADRPAAPDPAVVDAMFAAHLEVMEAARAALPATIARIGGACVESYRNGGKILLCGNGGSFSDALHVEGELTNRFRRDHEGLPAICLGAGGATLTATANDYSYDDLFARLVRAYGKPGDVLLGFTTSGNSRNVVAALEAARGLGVTTVALTGRTGGKAKAHADHLLNVPSDETPRIQEVHILAAHAICEIIEDALFPADAG